MELKIFDIFEVVYRRIVEGRLRSVLERLKLKAENCCQADNIKFINPD